jgi:hypothetical protein
MKVSPEARIRFGELTQTFLAEAAVLVFVFPTLERFATLGIRAVTWQLISCSFVLAGVLFVSALFVAYISGGAE